MEYYYTFTEPVDIEARYNSEGALMVPNIAFNVKDKDGGLIISVREETDIYWKN
jgi:hypothetical protein